MPGTRLSILTLAALALGLAVAVAACQTGPEASTAPPPPAVSPSVAVRPSAAPGSSAAPGAGASAGGASAGAFSTAAQTTEPSPFSGPSTSGSVVGVDPTARTLTVHFGTTDTTFAWDKDTLVVPAGKTLTAGSSVTVHYATSGDTKRAVAIVIHPPKRFAEQG
ncbi:MAG TPA: hypothetical protein VIH93_12870 [Thermoanaerobaculia bacterium]